MEQQEKIKELNTSMVLWGEPETLTLFTEESGHLVAAAEDNQP